MRASKFTENEILYAVKQLEAGISVQELSRKYGVSDKTIYHWRKKYDGLSSSELKRENAQLKKLVAELSLDKQILQEVLSQKL